MNPSTFKQTFYYAPSAPSSSSNGPAATNRPQTDENFSKLYRGMEHRWVSRAYDKDRVVANHQASPSIQVNVELWDPERLSTPSEPKAGGTSYSGSLASMTQNVFPTLPRKDTGKRKQYDAEVGGDFAPNKRPRREDSGHTHAFVGVAPGSILSSQPGAQWNAIAATGDTTGTGQCLFGTNMRRSASPIKRDTPTMEAPELSAANSINAAQSTSYNGDDKDDFRTFLNSILEGFKAKTESPSTSGDRKQTQKCDALKKERRTHVAPAAASYRWSDLYNEKEPRRQDIGHTSRKGPPPARAAWEDRVLHNGTRAEDAGIEPFPLATLGDISSETVAGPSSLAPALAVPVDTPATGSTPGAPFQYSLEAEAKIWSAAVQANYPKARSLFHPSECPRIIEGDELKQFVAEHPDRVRMAGRMATKLWVCQATAKWAADGTVTYAPEACRVTSTSQDICMRHIYTVHLGKGREKRALK